MVGNSKDLSETIRRLYIEKETLERAISALEALQASTTGMARGAGSKRGRKSMNSEERREVSLRMKKYWASRRVPAAESMDESKTRIGRL